MPIYQFIDNRTDEVFVEHMSSDDKNKYLLENPNILEFLYDVDDVPNLMEEQNANL